MQTIDTVPVHEDERQPSLSRNTRHIILTSTKARLLLANLATEGIDCFFFEKNDYPYLIDESVITNLCARMICQEMKSVLLVGPPGSGKTSLIRYFANYVDRLRHPLLSKFRILCVSVPSLLAGSEYRGSFEKKVTMLLSETESYDNLVIFFDEAHCIRFTNFREGIGLMDILKARMTSGKHRFIFATTTGESEHLAIDAAFMRRVHRITLAPLLGDQLRTMAEAHLSRLVNKHQESHHEIDLNSSVRLDELLSNTNSLSEVVDAIDFQLSARILNEYSI